MLKRLPIAMSGLILIETDKFNDPRGYFMETWQLNRYREIGIMDDFVQDNLSFSSQHVLRGLHYQKNPEAQGKLVSCLMGTIFDVAVDLRIGSPTFGRWEGVELSSDNHRQFFIPAGFAHGFCVLSGNAILSYKCTRFYNAASEKTIIWNDPSLMIKWPIETPNLSPKDQLGVPFSVLTESDLF